MIGHLKKSDRVHQMEYKILIYFLIFSFAANAEVSSATVLPKDFSDVVDFMVVSTGDARTIALSRDQGLVNCDPKETGTNEKQQVVIENNPEKSKWRFLVVSSYGVPTSSLKKHYTSGVPDDLRNAMDTFIATKYSYEDRMGAASQLCNGKSEMDRIQLASYLGGRLNGIYDYDRADSTKAVSSAIVTPADQWEALNQQSNGVNAVSGVCRDTAYTLTQFLAACGFNKKQLSIQSYKTVGAGHEVVSIRNSKGQLYTINWSELYSIDEKGGVAPSPSPGIANTGIDYFSYNADGKIVERRRTELGEVLKTVSGGTPRDPHYLPQLLRLEAGYGALSLNTFKTQTQLGDNAEGISAYLKTHDEQTTIYLSAGGAYATNQREFETGPTTTAKLDQSIFYFQAEVGAAPIFKVYDNQKMEIMLRPNVLLSSEIYGTKDSLSATQKKQSNGASGLESRIGLDLVTKKDATTAWIGGAVESGLISSFAGNTEATGSGAGLYVNSYNADAGVRWEKEKIAVEVKASSVLSTYEDRYSVLTSILDKKHNVGGSVVYTVYDRGQGFKDDYVVIQTEKSFKMFKRNHVSVGVGSRIPVSSDLSDSSVQATVRFN